MVAQTKSIYAGLRRRSSAAIVTVFSCIAVFSAQPALASPPMLAGGTAYSVAIPKDGSVWSWGANDKGQLGDGTFLPRLEPKRIGVASNWDSVASGFHHTIAIRGGTLWAWGQNSFGQLGDGTTVDKYTPTQIGVESNWARVAASGGHSLAIKRDGTLWAWGLNNWGQLGDGTKTTRLSPTRIGSGSNWLRVSTSARHTLATTSPGQLWAWGSNRWGQLGTGTTADSKVPVAIGSRLGFVDVQTGWGHSVARRRDGAIWVWGSNEYGQLGDGTFINKYLPIKFGSRSDWEKIFAQGARSFAIASDGSLWGWGRNQWGQLGDGTFSNRIFPVQVGIDSLWAAVGGSAHRTVAFRRDGSLWEWGRSNRTGLEGDLLDFSRPRQTSLNTSVKLSASNLNFGAIALGNVATIPVTISNESDERIFVTSVSIDAPFSVASVCGAVDAGGRCEVKVSFQPSSIGSFSGVVSLRSSAFAGARTVAVSASAMALPTASPTVSPTAVPTMTPTSSPTPSPTPSVVLTPSGGQCQEVGLTSEMTLLSNSLSAALDTVVANYESQIVKAKKATSCKSLKPASRRVRMRALQKSIEAEKARTILRASVRSAKICGSGCVTVNLDEAVRRIRNRISNLSKTAAVFSRKAQSCTKSSATTNIANLNSAIEKIRKLDTVSQVCR